jgi:hypothetical protein
MSLHSALTRRGNAVRCMVSCSDSKTSRTTYGFSGEVVTMLINPISVLTHLAVLIYIKYALRYGIKSIFFGLDTMKTRRTPPSNKWWNNQDGYKAYLLGMRIFMRGLLFLLPSLLALFVVERFIIDVLIQIIGNN